MPQTHTFSHTYTGTCPKSNTKNKASRIRIACLLSNWWCLPCTALIKCQPKATWRRKISFPLTLPGNTPGTQSRNSWQEPGGDWIPDHGRVLLTGLLPVACSAAFLTQPSRSMPLWIAPPTVSQSLLHWLAVLMLFHKHGHRPIWWRQCPSWGSLYQIDSSLSGWQKLSSTLGTLGAAISCSPPPPCWTVFSSTVI